MDFDLLQRYGPALLRGLLVTLEIVGLSLAIGGLLAIPLALARTSAVPLLRWPALAYIFFFRGTPLLAQTFLIYYGAGQFAQELRATSVDLGLFSVGLWDIFGQAYWCAIITFSLNTAAYTAEILRGGIQGVAGGEIEAARALGMSRGLILRRVVLPGAYRIALPAYGNEIILMVKGSAIASVITIYDLMGETKLAFSRSFDFAIYLYAAVIYFLLTWTITLAWARLEDWTNPQRRPPPDK